MRRAAAGAEGGVASFSLPRWSGPDGHRTVARPERGGHGSRRCAVLPALPLAAVAVAPGAEAPWVPVFLSSVKHTLFQRPRAPGPPGREAGARRRSPGEARAAGGAPAVPGQPFPRALLGAALDSGAGPPRSGRDQRPGREGAAGRTDSDKSPWCSLRLSGAGVSPARGSGWSCCCRPGAPGGRARPGAPRGADSACSRIPPGIPGIPGRRALLTSSSPFYSAN